VKLNNPTRYNPSIWDEQTLNGLKMGALAVCLLAASMSVLAAFFKFRAASRHVDAFEDKEHSGASLGC